MTAKRIMLTLTILGVIAIPAALLRVQASGSNHSAGNQGPQAVQGGLIGVIQRFKEAQAQQLEGSWSVIITPLPGPPGAPPPPPPFQVYQTYSRGGSLIGSDRTLPFTSPQHGAWVHTEGNEFASTGITDVFDALGNFTGTFKVRQSIRMLSKDEYSNVSNVKLRNPAGGLIFAACSTGRGTRITVEPFSLCQDVPLP